MAAVPHLRIPFRFGPDGSAEVVEQDSADEIAQCVATLVKTRQGERIEVPTYGIPDQTFLSDPAMDASVIQTAVEEWEPRAEVTVASSPARFDESARVMSIEVRTRSGIGTTQGAGPVIVEVSP